MSGSLLLDSSDQFTTCTCNLCYCNIILLLHQSSKSLFFDRHPHKFCMHFLFPPSKTSKTDIEQVITAASQGCNVVVKWLALPIFMTWISVQISTWKWATLSDNIHDCVISSAKCQYSRPTLKQTATCSLPYPEYINYVIYPVHWTEILLKGRT